MLELTAEAEIYTRGVTIMKRTLAVLIICGLALSGCGKTETDGAELRAGKTESASAVSTVNSEKNHNCKENRKAKADRSS